MRTHLAALLGIAALTLTGCSSSLAQTDVEDEITSQFSAEVPDGEASCPGDLEATEDASMECTLTDAEGTEYPVEVTVTSVDGDTINFDMEILPE